MAFFFDHRDGVKLAEFGIGLARGRTAGRHGRQRPGTGTRVVAGGRGFDCAEGYPAMGRRLESHHQNPSAIPASSLSVISGD